MDSVKTGIGEGRNVCEENGCNILAVRLEWNKWSGETGGRKGETCAAGQLGSREEAPHGEQSLYASRCWMSILRTVTRQPLEDTDYRIILQGPEMKVTMSLMGIPTWVYLGAPPHPTYAIARRQECSDAASVSDHFPDNVYNLRNRRNPFFIIYYFIIYPIIKLILKYKICPQ